MPRWVVDFLLLSAIWGSSFLFTRLAMVEFGAMGTALGRVTIAAGFLLPLAFARGLGPVLRRHWKAMCVIGAFNSGIPFALFAFALATITTGLSSILNATVPLFGALVAWAWIGDRPGASRAIGLLIGFAGVGLLALDGASFAAGDGAPGWAIAACLVATLSYGISATAARQYLVGVPALAIAAGCQMGATLVLVVPTLFAAPVALPGLRAWLALVALGVLCTGLAYILYFRLIEQAGPSRAMTVTFVVPVFAVFYGVLFLGETVTAWMLGCAAVIVVGTALAAGLLQRSAR